MARRPSSAIRHDSQIWPFWVAISAPRVHSPPKKRPGVVLHDPNPTRDARGLRGQFCWGDIQNNDVGCQPRRLAPACRPVAVRIQKLPHSCRRSRTSQITPPNNNNNTLIQQQSAHRPSPYTTREVFLARSYQREARRSARRKRQAPAPMRRGATQSRRPREEVDWLVAWSNAQRGEKGPLPVLSVSAPRRAPGGPPGDMKPPGSPTLRAAQRWRVTKVPRASPLPDHPDEAEGLASAQ